MAFLAVLRQTLKNAPLKLITTPKRASVAAIFRPCTAPGREDSVELLFIRRKVNPKDPWSGHMAFPGGRVQRGEEDLAAAIRETEEEIGLTLQESDLIGRLSDCPVYYGSTVASPFIFLLKKDTPLNFVLQPNEVSDAMWVDIDFIRQATIRSLKIPTKLIFPKPHEYSVLEERYLAPLKDATIDFPCIYLARPDGLPSGVDDTSRQVSDFVLWGLTYNMTSDILHAGGHDKLPTLAASVLSLREAFFQHKMKEYQSNL